MRLESPYNLPGRFTGTRMPSANDEPQLELPLPRLPGNHRGSRRRCCRVSPDDRAAIAALKVAPPQRAEIEQAVIDRRQRLGWIVFIDSMDPDGDTVAVEASAPTQPIVLTKSWTAVAVMLAIG